jgi:hypothetical protein
MALLALVAYRRHEDLVVEVRAHSLDDLVIEKAIRLRLAAEEAPLASSPRSGLGLGRSLAIFQASELARGDHFGNPQTVPFCLVGGHAMVLLLLLAVLGEHVEAADPISWFDGHVRPGATRAIRSCEGRPLRRVSQSTKPPAEIALARDRFVAAHLAEAQRIVDRAIKRSELLAATDPAALVELVVAWFFAWYTAFARA